MEEINLKRKVNLKRKGDNEGISTPPKKSKWWLWLLLSLGAIVVVIFLVKNSSSDGNNQMVSDKIELATTKANEITNDIQNVNVNFDEAQAKVAEAQKAVDEAKANAKTDEEKQSVAETQAKVDEARRTVEQEKASDSAKTPAIDEAVITGNVEPVAGEQAATASAAPVGSAQSARVNPPTQPVQSGQSVAAASTTPAPSLPQGTLEEKAKQVIRGDYGNGIDRKSALGSEYRAIQDRVNEMYRNGEF